MLAAANAEAEKWPTKLVEQRRCRDDAFTTVRVRHPTDRGMVPATVDNHHPSTLDAEQRSRAFSANARVFADRVNVYKRYTNGESPASPGLPTSTGSVSGEKEEQPGFRRLTFLQRSLRVSPSTKVSPDSKKAHQLSLKSHGHSPKSPILHHSPLNNILDLFRNRSHSDSTTKRPCRRMKHSASNKESPEPEPEPAGPLSRRDRKSAFSQCPFSQILDEDTADSSIWPAKSVDNLSPFDELSSPVMRKRSNSDNSKFYVLRKTSIPGGSELLGKLNTSNYKDDAYLQLLKTFTCYHLMSIQSAVIAFDGFLKMKQAFCALVANGVRAALLWDQTQDSAIGMVTATDLLSGLRYKSYPIGEEALNSSLLHCLKDCDCRPPAAVASSQSAPPCTNDQEPPPHHSLALHYGCKRKRPCSFVTIDGSVDLYSAFTVIRLNKIHRLPIIDEESGNVLHFLTTKKILHFMYRQMCNSSLPLPTRMHKTLDELLPADNGCSLISIENDESLDVAVHKLLDNCLSSLPVVDATSKIVQNVLNKVDIMNFVAEHGWTDFTKQTVRDALASRHVCMEKMVACHRKTPLILAVDRLIRENAHRIIVVNSNGCLSGVISIGSVISFLTS